MAWDFETDPEFQEKLDWMDEFVREKVEPLGLLGIHPYDVKNPRRNKLVRPLQEEVKARGLWACHLGPELGGQGYGQVKLGLMNVNLWYCHIWTITLMNQKKPEGRVFGYTESGWTVS